MTAIPIDYCPKVPYNKDKLNKLFTKKATKNQTSWQSAKKQNWAIEFATTNYDSIHKNGCQGFWCKKVEVIPRKYFERIEFKGKERIVTVHLGDITKINGAAIAPVDVITFGSPCQDLSVAGKRQGMKHSELGDEEATRSGLLMEAIRIIKEMRDATDGAYPTIAVWENVPGAFSSNQSEDFRAVLEELVRIVEPDTVIPGPPQGKWKTSGCIMGDGWSLAWRILDAQFWGVPQRRRRISLVADFGGQSAPEVLFVRHGMSRDPATGEKARKRIARNPAFGTGGTGEGNCLNQAYGIQGSMIGRADKNGPQGDGVNEEICFTLNATDRHAVAYGIGGYHSAGMLSDNPHAGIYIADTSRTLDLNGGNPACNQGGIAICEPMACDVYNLGITGNVAATLSANTGTSATHSGPTVLEPVMVLNDQGCSVMSVTEDVTATLRAQEHGHQPIVCEPIAIHQNADGEIRAGTVANTLNTNSNASGRNAPLVAVFDARGNGDGLIAPTMTGDHQNRTSDFTALAVLPFDTTQITSPQNGNNPKYGDPCHPLCASAHVPAIVESYQNATGPLMANSHPGSYTGQDAYTDMLVTEPQCFTQRKFGEYEQGVGTITTTNGVGSTGETLVAGIDCRNLNESPELYPTMQAKEQGGWSLNYSHAVRVRYRVRRLTPMECERLQGYPDNWTLLPEITDMSDDTYAFWRNLLFEQAVREEKARMNPETGEYEIWRFVSPKPADEAEDPEGYWENTGKPYKHKAKQQMIGWYNRSFADPDGCDSVRYKALGNSIALPPWKWVMKRISALFERDATLGSLFDGIGGFPLVWEQINGIGTALWASEIEAFPIAVTKYHFTRKEA